MTTKKTSAKAQSAAEKVEPVEAKYSRLEIMRASASFKVSPEVMAGALRLAKKDELTRIEVEQAIKQFKERKV